MARGHARDSAQRDDDSARLPAHNLTEAEVKAWFLGPSPAGARLRAYFAPHEALLPPLVKREGVRVFGATL